MQIHLTKYWMKILDERLKSNEIDNFFFFKKRRGDEYFCKDLYCSCNYTKHTQHVKSSPINWGVTKPLYANPGVFAATIPLSTTWGLSDLWLWSKRVTFHTFIANLPIITTTKKKRTKRKKTACGSQYTVSDYWYSTLQWWAWPTNSSDRSNRNAHTSFRRHWVHLYLPLSVTWAIFNRLIFTSRVHKVKQIFQSPTTFNCTIYTEKYNDI